MELRALEIITEIISMQEKKLLKMGRQIVPNLTTEDVLQPNDYPELENSPLFRYEEGVLEGLKTSQMALQAHLKDLSSFKS